jgi:hypothetical protein
VQVGRWYVAVVGRNLTARDGQTEKTFTLSLVTGAAYDSTWAICITVLVPFAVRFVCCCCCVALSIQLCDLFAAFHLL